jgi:hypothetical protein
VDGVTPPPSVNDAHCLIEAIFVWLFPLMKRLAVCIVLLLLSSSKAFAEFTGLVVSILGGDTITVLKDGNEEVIRLTTALKRARFMAIRPSSSRPTGH